MLAATCIALLAVVCMGLGLRAHQVVIVIGLCGLAVCGILAVISQMGCPT